MSISPVHGTSDEERGKRFFFAFYEQWSAFLSLGTQNWIDFTFIKLQGEVAPYSGRVELEMALLGLHLTVTYVYDQSFNDDMRDMKGRIENELLGRTGATEIIDPTGALDKLGK